MTYNIFVILQSCITACPENVVHASKFKKKIFLHNRIPNIVIRARARSAQGLATQSIVNRINDTRSSQYVLSAHKREWREAIRMLSLQL